MLSRAARRFRGEIADGRLTLHAAYLDPMHASAHPDAVQQEPDPKPAPKPTSAATVPGAGDNASTAAAMVRRLRRFIITPTTCPASPPG